METFLLVSWVALIFISYKGVVYALNKANML